MSEPDIINGRLEDNPAGLSYVPDDSEISLPAIPEIQQNYLEQKSAALLNMLTDLEDGRRRIEDSESRFRTIYEKARDGIVLIDHETGAGINALQKDET